MKRPLIANQDQPFLGAGRSAAQTLSKYALLSARYQFLSLTEINASSSPKEQSKRAERVLEGLL